MKISVFVVVKHCVCSQLMWWSTPEGNWLLTSAKNHLESSWLQVNEKRFIALIVTAYSFMFEQMNSESSHHRRNGTWRWTLITGFDLLGIYWDKLTRSLTQRPSQQNTQLLSYKHSLYQSYDLRRQWCGLFQCSFTKMITYTDVCACESIVCVIQWVMNHLPAQEIKDFHPFHPGTEKWWRRWMQFIINLRGSTTVLEGVFSYVVFISVLHNTSEGYVTFCITIGSFLRDIDEAKRLSSFCFIIYEQY